MNDPAARSHTETSLRDAAAEGWFIAAESFGVALPDVGAPVANGRFERRNYLVRPACEADVPALLQLEAQCWPEGLGVSEEVLLQRLREHPAGQLVLEFEGQVAAAVYSQRIARLRQLQGLRAREVEALHRADGAIVQLLAVNVLPQLQDRAFGDQLLEFMLQLCALMPGVDTVVGVTRCKDYGRHAGMAYDAYTALRNERGSLVDTVLRFHEAHGATVRGPMAGYRPADRANRGYGVLVHYDIRRRQRPVNEVAAPAPIRTDTDPRRFVTGAVAAVLGVEAGQVPPDGRLFALGMDSAGLLDLNERIGAAFGTRLEPAFFFEFDTVEKIAGYLQAGRTAPEPPAPARAETEAPHQGEVSPRDVAIIGVAFRLPGDTGDVEDEEALWRLLSGGHDAISDLPAGRWAWPAGIDPQDRHRGIARGGFLRDIAGFDAALFRISPHDAELMDPQQRMLLELSWACFEDAGYAPSSMAGSRTGVYVGASGSDYGLLMKDGRAVEPQTGLGSAVAVLPNRVSYFHDLRGPSVQVDTACSSSLVALHDAVQALRAGGCEQALVAGIHLMCHPANSIAYYKAGMLSPDGRCASFDAAANGYVRGEGAVVLLLKPLARALAEGDRIHAVVKGTAVNHGGRASGLTVPNPVSQAELLRAAQADAGVDAASIGYVEAHGTGTALGDPIEVRALKDAFAGSEGACGLGSVKTQLGHLEAAAGLAGLLKVVVAMRRETLPPSAHFTRLNPHIALAGSPFHIVAQARPWPADARQPRHAGVSSFGSGGTNAHAVLEAFDAPPARTPAGGPFAFVLSARTLQQLKVQAGRLAHALAAGRFTDADLGDIAFTLQVGRDAMPARLGCVAASVEELRGTLERFAEGHAAGADMFVGEARRDGEALAALGRDDDMAATLAAWAAKGKLASLLALWVQGVDLDWQRLFGAAGARRVGLPSHAFAREPYWLPPAEHAAANAQAVLHPLVHRNASTLEGQRFTSTFTGQEFFLADHRVQGERVLPAAAQLEMACAAALLSSQPGHGARLQLLNAVFARPVVVGDQPAEVYTELWPQADGAIGFAVRGSDGTLHSQGSLLPQQDTGVAPVLDLAALRAACGEAGDAAALYAAFSRMGFGYGPAHRGITAFASGADGNVPPQLLADITLPPSLADTRYGLHPTVLDAAFQAATALAMREAGIDPDIPLLPFALDSLDLFAAPGAGPLHAWVRFGAGTGASERLRKIDIDLCDGGGRVCVRIQGYAARPMDGQVAAVAQAELLAPVWEPCALARTDAPVTAVHHVVLGPCHAEHASALLHALQAQGCHVLAGDGDGIAARYTEAATQLLVLMRGILLDQAPGSVLVQLVVGANGDDALNAGLFGLLKSAQQENPKLRVQCIACPAGMGSNALASMLRAECHTSDMVVRYRDGLREVQRWDPAEPAADAAACWKDGGVYLVTGGLGGLGWIFAQEIARRAVAPVLVLVGRSPLDGERTRQLEALRAMGAQAEYHQLDVNDAPAVEALVQDIAARFGTLNGILHAAGVLRDGYLVRQTPEDLQAVLAPKVAGLVNLDHASRDLPLDCLLLFSSVVSVLGNAGQAGYAAANGFLDAFSEWRTERGVRSERRGRTLCVHWPLWAEGGMQVDGDTASRLQATWGTPLATAQALDAFERAWRAPMSRAAVFTGGAGRWQAGLRQAVATPAEQEAQPTAVAGTLEDGAVRYLQRVLGDALKLAPERVDVDAPLEQYGIDSFLVLRLTEALEKDFGSLSKTLFFEYQNLRSLAGHFARAHAGRLAVLVGGAGNIPAVPAPAARPAVPRTGRSAPARAAPAPLTTDALDIAVIGVAGHYPQARTLREFWRNLSEGRDCITEVPSERWDHARYFDADKDRTGTTYGKWGGFIDGVDEFDALFFNVPPREAALIDPQERLFAQCAWETLEDAGYTRERLARQARHGVEGSVGVFVGVMYEEYQLYGAQEQARGRNLALFGSPSSIANRVSYFCNLHGPSMAVDTMCSSSLTAIHLACQSLREGGCEVAIAGGVNVSIHPNKYLFLARGRFISSKGRCESFGEGGDGYVPGEGVGAVLLKPLARAIADGDRIHGVIKGTAVNHGGKTNGYSVPNPVAQAALIRQAMERAGVHPRAVSYIEAHGTGTSLGDPIEIAGLARAFAEQTQDRQFCAIGSAKSNIGHCESAAGIAGLTKVLLQLKHGQIAPSLHSEVLNPHIDFAATPFTVQQELAEWKRPMVSLDGGPARELPRIAGISSFGAGGANAHLVIQEYVAPQVQAVQVTQDRPVVIVLSARDADRLHEHARNLLQAITQDGLGDDQLADLAYTLQIGREAMEERLAFTAASMNDVVNTLRSFIAGDARDEWVAGHAPDWHALYPSHARPRLISLPTYPFARERHWLQLSQDDAQPIAAAGPRREPRLLVKGWEPCPAVAGPRTARNVAIIVNAETLALGEQLTLRFARASIIDPSQPTDEPDWEHCDGWIDLAGCGQTFDTSIDWIAPLQRLIEHGPRTGFIVLGVSRGLEAFGGASTNLAGAARAGLYRMLQSETPRLRSRHVDVDAGMDDAQLADCIAGEFLAEGEDSEICHRQGVRYRARLEETTLPGHGPLPPLDDTVLWITGGTRGIGMACARHFVQRHGVHKLVLTGREAFPPREEWHALAALDTPVARKVRDVQALETAGAQVHVCDVDLTDEDALRREIATVHATLGPIGALLHSAGMVDTDTPALVRKSAQGIARVMAPKVAGLATLLRCLGDEPLRWAALFSSVSAMVPSLGAGHADYAMANACMDYVAQAHQGPYPLISVQWPSWKDAGFGEIKSPAYRATGLLAHGNDEGLDLLDRLIAAGRSGAWLPAMVDPANWRPDTLMRRSLLEAAAPQANAPASQAPQTTGVLDTWLTQLLAEQLGMDPDRVRPDVPLLEYGMDSVLMLQFLRAVGRHVGTELDPSILFEHPTLEAFGGWLRQAHGDAVPAPPPAAPAAAPVAVIHASPTNNDIAVIGMSCSFPGAPDLDAYWALLSQGRSALRRVPFERWGTHEEHYAGLLGSIDRFDPGFFLLSEADARAMDPQALLVLEQSLNLIYQAGYAPRELKGRAVGVYLGARSRHQPDAARLRAAEHPILSVGQNYMAANVSRFFDLRGPAVVVDTACSSALVAMQMAAQALQAGDVEAALVGGVNLLHTDEPLRIFAQRGILQAGATFHLFDERAQGAVLGEGAGMVLLKPLAQALADGDRIDAVIAGMAINNDGRTASPVAPSLQAQVEVMRAALRKSGLGADSIAHVEVNGSGSQVTDLLELKAIEAVYRDGSHVPCSLGSVKPNIGHPLCAEGIAGFIKLALMLRHGQGVPFLSAQQPLKHYDFAASPLFFRRATEPWSGVPRAAALNCFGDGGTNAHVVLRQAPEHHAPTRQPLQPPALRRIDLRAPTSVPTDSQPAAAAGFWGRLTVLHSQSPDSP
ncbi:MAG: SDR family NAD(P)-dependent oxidoreductase [Pseudomonadota bacterium]